MKELREAAGERWCQSGQTSPNRIVLLSRRASIGCVIQSFADETTRKVWDLERAPRLGTDVQRAAHKRLQMLDVARTINDLRVPPGNRLEKLVGDRSGQYSIRVNDQYRICFAWADAGPVDVQIVDYH